jgi:hypothetical protein
MPHTRSRRACSSRAAAACGTQIPGLEPRFGPLSRKNAIVGSCSPVRGPSGEVLNLPFQGRFLLLTQRVSEWQAFPSLRVIFPVHVISSRRVLPNMRLPIDGEALAAQRRRTASSGAVSPAL